ncbi:hypothetical protein IKE98_03820 [Candidatus Saccharibacteria bacterium]|nr:hypothetical protein [Candidatus Saccharibacteria bacterium]
MAKTSTKPKTKTKTKKGKKAYESQGVNASYCVVFLLIIALIVAITVSVVTTQTLKSLGGIVGVSKIEVFDHIADNYIESMDFTVGEDNQPTTKNMTGYGVSDEDGVFYITFDFTPYTVESNNRVPDGETRHAIIYFWKDEERGTYSHAFSYHDDASYHPDGAYVKIDE